MADSSEAGTGAMSGDGDAALLQGIADRAGATKRLLGLPRRFTFSSLGAETILRVFLVQTEPFLLRSGAEALRLRRAMWQEEEEEMVKVKVKMKTITIRREDEEEERN